MTLKQVANILNTPESTVRLYRDEFDEFIPATGESRRRRYDTAAVEILRRIIESKKSGVAGANIRQELARTSTPQEKKRGVSQEDRIAGIQMSLESQGSELAALRAEVAALRSEIGRLIVLLSSEKQAGRDMETVQRELLTR